MVKPKPVARVTKRSNMTITLVSLSCGAHSNFLSGFGRTVTKNVKDL